MTAAARMSALPHEPYVNPADYPAVDAELHLIAAGTCAAANDVARYAELVTSADFGDPHHGIIWQSVADLAAAGTDPTAPLVLDRITEHGQHTDAVRRRVLDVATCRAAPESLRQYVTAVVGAAFRRQLAAVGAALIESGDLSEYDAWSGFIDGEMRARQIHDRLATLRGAK